MTSDVLRECAVGNVFHILVRSNFTSHSGIYLSTGTHVDHIPHFGFTHAVVTFCGESIVGMHLHRQVVIGIDEFYEDREFCAESAQGNLAYEFLAVLCDEIV